MKLWFENRKLRGYIEEQDQQIKTLTAQLETMRDNYDREVADRRDERGTLNQEIIDHRKEIKTLKAKLRDQAGADMLFAALKAMGALPPDEKEPDPRAMFDAARAQMDAMRPQSMSEQRAGAAFNDQYGQQGLANVLGGGLAGMVK